MASITISRRRAEHGPFTEEDLPLIEAEMRRIIAADKPLVREVWDRERRPRTSSSDHGEAFKAEWVMELPEGEPITMYQLGHGRGRTGSTCAAVRISPRPASSTRTRSS